MSLTSGIVDNYTRSKWANAEFLFISYAHRMIGITKSEIEEIGEIAWADERNEIEWFSLYFQM